jgi:hypothetical protein
MSRRSDQAFMGWATRKRDDLIGRLNLLRSGKIAVFRAQYGRRVDFTAEDIRALEEQLAELNDLLAKHV